MFAILAWTNPDPHALGTYIVGISVMILMVSWWVSCAFFWLRLVHWRCPNCGRWYHWIGPFMNPFAGDCQKCGWHP